jgi:tetratricopeptide (TPR) repeat protein
LINEGKFQEARGELETVLSLPEAAEAKEIRARAHYGLSAVQANLGNLKEALAEVERSLQLAPRSQDALALRARLIRAMK